MDRYDLTRVDAAARSRSHPAIVTGNGPRVGRALMMAAPCSSALITPAEQPANAPTLSDCTNGPTGHQLDGHLTPGLAGKRVAVQGLGNVDYHAAKFMAEGGAVLGGLSDMEGAIP